MNSKEIASLTVGDTDRYKSSMEEMIDWQRERGNDIKDFDCYILQGKYVVVHRESGECYYTDGLPDVITFGKEA